MFKTKRIDKCFSTTQAHTDCMGAHGAPNVFESVVKNKLNPTKQNVTRKQLKGLTTMAVIHANAPCATPGAPFVHQSILQDQKWPKSLGVLPGIENNSTNVTPRTLTIRINTLEPKTQCLVMAWRTLRSAV